MREKIAICTIAVFQILGAKEFYELQRQVTTATRFETEVQRVPGNVDIIDKEQMLKRTPQKITDIIKNNAGIYIPKDAGLNIRPSIMIRGITNGTLVLMDGVILSDMDGETRLLSQIPYQDIDRVEIVRGPFSSLYGTGAIGGVVNFITSMPTNFEAKVSLGYGNELEKRKAQKNLFRGYFSIGDTFFDKRLRIKAIYGFNTTQGYPLTPALINQAQYQSLSTNGVSGFIPYTDSQYVVGDIGRQAYTMQNGRIKLEYDWGDKDTTILTFMGANYLYKYTNIYSNLTRNKKIFYGGDDLFNPFLENPYGGIGNYTNLLGSISHKHFFEKSSLNITLSSVNMIGLYNGATTSPAGIHPTLESGYGSIQDLKTSSNYLDMLYDIDFEKHFLTIGIQGRFLNLSNKSYISDTYQSFKGTREYKKGLGANTWYLSALFQFNSNWSKKLSTTIGTRYDYWKMDNVYNQISSEKNNIIVQGKGAFSPKASLNYEIFSGTLLKFEAGSAFRAPTTREMFNTQAKYEWIFSPNLKPEYGIAFDFGIEQDVLKNGIFKIYYYQSDILDAIYAKTLGKNTTTNKTIKQNRNAGHIRINGIEIEYSQPIAYSILILANYTWTNSKMIKNSADPSLIDKRLPIIPQHMAHLMVLYGEEIGFYGSLQATYQSRALKDFGVWGQKHTFGSYDEQFYFDAKIGYRFISGFDINMSFLNFTNSLYFNDYQAPGASFYAQISKTF
ncbi:TonB-dependent receptor [Helicobacter sp. 13S00477-4]|uniref:TonB-dependent receptor n=1 Tax=Helicobacter sp. 13S00477-4 TaxID=1905759 RepID=UPI000BDC01BF|nr:TonB-dependent receptor [Helicobacter sp. 13S00477-4]PAF52688.1 hypothetical protein BKH44_00450 [Helicobacter sp. 13S00477-4]